MRSQLPKRAIATTAAVLGVLALIGCVAQSWAQPPEPAAGFAGLDARVQEASAAAAASGTDIEAVVLDRTTGQLVSTGDNTALPIASVVKLFIADDLLLQQSQGSAELSAADRASLDAMLRSSDDGAARNNMTQAVKTMFPTGRI